MDREEVMGLAVIVRYIRLLSMPLLMLGLAAFLAMLARDSESVFEAAAVVDTLMKPASKVFGVLGSLWLLWSALQLFRWDTSGDTDGDCVKCGRHMTPLDGRHGFHRKCMHCGHMQKGC